MSMTASDLRAETRRDGIEAMTSVFAGRRPEIEVRSLPPVTGHAEVDAAIARFRELDADSRRARAEMNALDQQTRAVAEQDRDALAVAIRTGTADPGDKGFKAHATKLAEATRRASALKLALRQQGDVVWKVLAANAADLARVMSSEYAEAQAAVATDLARLRGSAGVAEVARAKARWADGLAQNRSRYVETKSKSGLGYGNGNEFTVAALLDALEATVTE